ncbi:MAG TPA: glycosyltransferase [Acidimicrobiia bacterium]|nr:glycosyltransferase [Acidimicrobiia bacterium]
MAHLIDSLDVSGGAERQLVSNLRSFDHSQISHHVVLIKSSSTSRASDLPDSVDTWVLSEDGAAMSRLEVTRALHRLVKREGFDLIHASLPDSALAARLVGMLTGVPVVESLVNISHEAIRTVDNPAVTRPKLAFHRWLDRLTTMRVRRFHAVSEAVADSWTDTVGIDRDRIDVIPRGIDMSVFHKDDRGREASRRAVLEEFGLPKDTFLVVAVGRLEPQKGHRYLIEAAHLLTEEIPEMRVLIVGRAGSSAQRLEAKVKELGLEDVIVMTGSRTDLPRLLSASDVFAFPSLFEGNGGNAMIEAMAMGLPVVTTAAAPMTDLIPDDRHGILVPRRDPEALADALRVLHAQPKLRSQLGDAARKRTEGFLSPEGAADRYEDWYKSLLGVPT